MDLVGFSTACSGTSSSRRTQGCADSATRRGYGIGLPPVLHFGSDELKQRIVPACIRGEKRIALAITEVRLHTFRASVAVADL